MRPVPARTAPATLVDIDWDAWVPEVRATLLFVLHDEQVLLIRKKRGLGAGKINGPGGRLEPGETALAAAIREVQEEVCITPVGVRSAGEVAFQFTDGFSLLVYVFTADGYVGEPAETDEAIPLWVDRTGIPFDEMWADDVLWFPMLLAGTSFQGRFLFDSDTLLDHDIDPPSPRCVAIA
jgi:8-oxo-dGTP diphosphatase